MRIPEEALTKAEHDALVEKRGRPLTDDAPTRRTDPTIHPDGTGVTQQRRPYLKDSIAL